jgi:hypothetical protein
VAASSIADRAYSDEKLAPVKAITDLIETDGDPGKFLNGEGEYKPVTGPGIDNDHDHLANRAMDDQHPISAISGLTEDLASMAKKDFSNVENDIDFVIAKTVGNGGYIKFRSGIIMQWGYAISANIGIFSVNLQIPFSTATYRLFLFPAQGNPNTAYVFNEASGSVRTTTAFYVQRFGITSTNFYESVNSVNYFAVGI